jgi:hypothetical protein
VRVRSTLIAFHLNEKRLTYSGDRPAEKLGRTYSDQIMRRPRASGTSDTPSFILKLFGKLPLPVCPSMIVRHVSPVSPVTIRWAERVQELLNRDLCSQFGSTVPDGRIRRVMANRAAVSHCERIFLCRHQLLKIGLELLKASHGFHHFGAFSQPASSNFLRNAMCCVTSSVTLRRVSATPASVSLFASRQSG